MSKKCRFVIAMISVLFLTGCKSKDSVQVSNQEVNGLVSSGGEKQEQVVTKEEEYNSIDRDKNHLHGVEPFIPQTESEIGLIQEDFDMTEDKDQEVSNTSGQEPNVEDIAMESSQSRVPESGLYKNMIVPIEPFVPLQQEEKVVYLTFDDGPCESTPQLLKVLRELNVKATFFVTSQFGTDEKVVGWMRQIAEEGHSIGVHSYSHRYKEIYHSVEDFLDDYKKMDDLIIEATGERSNLYRFPGGSNTGFNNTIRESLVRDLTSRGILYYDWNAYDGDCDGFTRNQMIEKTVKEASYKNKSIVLMHDLPGKTEVIQALPQIVKQLRQKGYEFKALDAKVKPIQFVKAEEVAADLYAFKEQEPVDMPEENTVESAEVAKEQ